MSSYQNSMISATIFRVVNLSFPTRENRLWWGTLYFPKGIKCPLPLATFIIGKQRLTLRKIGQSHEWLIRTMPILVSKIGQRWQRLRDWFFTQKSRTRGVVKLRRLCIDHFVGWPLPSFSQLHNSCFLDSLVLEGKKLNQLIFDDLIWIECFSI